MTKILVTGANGFIGKRVVPQLLDMGYEVYGMQRELGVVPCKYRVVLCDLSNEQQVEVSLRAVLPTHLLHLAWYTDHGKFWDSLENIDWIRKSLFLVRKFIEFGGERVVVTGSCAEYSWDQELLSEDCNSYQPLSLYGQSKHFLRGLLEGVVKNSGVSLAWARIFFLYGPGEPQGKIVASMIRQFVKGDPFILKNGRLCRDFLHVDDVAGALACIVDAPFTGAVNIGSGEPVYLSNLGDILCSIIKKGELIVSNESIHRDSEKLIADVNKLKTVLRWSPKFGLESGLRNVVECSQYE